MALRARTVPVLVELRRCSRMSCATCDGWELIGGVPFCAAVEQSLAAWFRVPNQARRIRCAAWTGAGRDERRHAEREAVRRGAMDGYLVKPRDGTYTCPWCGRPGVVRRRAAHLRACPARPELREAT